MLLCLLVIACAEFGEAQSFESNAKRVYALKKKIRKKPACSDRKDNDKDKLRDFPRDPGCKSRRDNNERNPKKPIIVTPTPSVPSQGQVEVGVNSPLYHKQIFPLDNPWNTDISEYPVDPSSEAIIASIGRDRGLHPDFGTFWEGAPIGFSYLVVSGAEEKRPVSFYYQDESDPGPYPVPSSAPIEGGPLSTGDRHVLVVDRDNWLLYEMFDARWTGDKWNAGSGAIFDLKTNALRPAGWTSADAAGLPILPGLVRYDEVHLKREINHALRFTVSRSRRAYVPPARHFASRLTDSALPPMGMRVRLKASFDISRFSSDLQVILLAMKRYGMIVADNGSDWFVSGVHDTRWNDDALSDLKQVKGSDFEVLRMDGVVTD